MTYTQQTAGINEEQKAAVETEQNAVIAAGAGSGREEAAVADREPRRFDPRGVDEPV